MKLDAPVRQLYIQTGYFTDAYFANRRSNGLPVPHEAAPVERLDSRPQVWDWRTGQRTNEAELAEQFNADVPAVVRVGEGE